MTAKQFILNWGNAPLSNHLAANVKITADLTFWLFSQKLKRLQTSQAQFWILLTYIFEATPGADVIKKFTPSLEIPNLGV